MCAWPLCKHRLRKSHQLQCAPRGRETRPEAESDLTRVTLPRHAGTCRDPVLPGTSPAQARLLTSWNPGLASAGRPAGRFCLGPVRRLELPTTYFSGQEEPFGVRGLSFGARTIKIKTARTPGQPGPGNQHPQREELLAARTVNRAGAGGGRALLHTTRPPILFSDSLKGSHHPFYSCRNQGSE